MMSDKMSSLDRINVRRLLLHTEKQIKDMVINYAEPTEESIRNTINPILDSISSRSESKLKLESCKTIFMTWEKLYPSGFKRGLAKASVQMLKWGWIQDREERWYHHVLPFIVIKTPVIDESCEGMGIEYIYAHTSIHTEIVIREPYSYVESIIGITPLLAAESIVIDFTIFNKE